MSEVKRLADRWNFFSPPIRPSNREIEEIEKIINVKIGEYKQFRVLILGGTPEFISLLSKYNNCDVVAFDINKSNLEAMSLLSGSNNNFIIEYFIGNWINKYDDLVGKFDIVLADTTMYFFDFPDGWKTCLNNIYNYLRNDGIFITRQLFFPEILPSFSSYFDIFIKSWRSDFVDSSRDNIEQYCADICKLKTLMVLEAADSVTSLDQKKLKKLTYEMIDGIQRVVPRGLLKVAGDALFSPGPSSEGCKCLPVSIPRKEEALVEVKNVGFYLEKDLPGDVLFSESFRTLSFHK